MARLTTVLTLVLAVAALASGCTRATPAMLGSVLPIPHQPPITTSGVLQSYDRTTMILTFEDGRVVQIAPQTRVGPSVGGRLCPGELVIVTDAVPIGRRIPAGSAPSSS